MKTIQNARTEPHKPEDFTAMWKAIKKEENCTTEAAMKKAVRTCPDLHSAFLKGQRCGKSQGMIIPATYQPHDFILAWQAIKKEENCTTEAAMKKAVRNHPELHEAYLTEQQAQGGRA